MAKLVKNNKQEMSLFNHVVKAVIEIKISFFFLNKIQLPFHSQFAFYLYKYNFRKSLILLSIEIIWN